MYYKRKIDKYLDEWLLRKDKSPALVVGIRQCGKTQSIIEFAKRNNLTLIELNFWTHQEYCKDFDNSLEVDELISNISLRFPQIKINPSNSLIFFDEIQECPRARLSFKNFEKDGRYNVIGSGSYLGINGYIKGDSTPAPIGYEEVYNMKTMDFEEFLWALGYTEEQIDNLSIYLKDRKPVPENLHELFKSEFLKYTCLGGFPKVVKDYVNKKNLMSAYRILNSIVFDMKSDFGRRKDKNGNPSFMPSEVSRIQRVFDLIPSFLAKENKRFIVSKIESGTSAQKKDAIEYLIQAHIISKAYNLEIPSLPLNGEKIESQFKLFPEDIGLVTSMYGLDTLIAISKGNLGQGKGAIYEALVFDSLIKSGFEPYYFAKESGLEIDFVISYQGYATLIEAKAKNGNTKSSKTVLKNKDHYGETKLIKIGDYNIGSSEDTLTIPHYMTFLLSRFNLDY